MKGSKVRILEHIQKYGYITSMDAFQHYGITRLSGRIFDLRKMGYDIQTMDVESVNRYGEPVRFARYYLKGEMKNGK